MGGCNRTGQCRLVALPRPLPASWRGATTSNVLSRGLVAAAKPVPAAGPWRSSYHVLSVDQQFSGLAGLSAGIQAEPDGKVAALGFGVILSTWGAVRLNESAVYVLSPTQRQPSIVNAAWPARTRRPVSQPLIAIRKGTSCFTRRPRQHNCNRTSRRRHQHCCGSWAFSMLRLCTNARH
jgi:hypothetical protein